MRKGNDMNSLERVLTAIGQKEADRVPFFLLLTMHGAKELGLGIKEYFSKADHVVEGQLKLRAKYKDDCIYTFFYAPVEVEAYGGEVIYSDDGPPNSGLPFIKNFSDIDKLKAVDPKDSACLHKVLEATSKLKAEVGDEVPIIGVVMSPFSVPVMQMGFEEYLVLMAKDEKRFKKLMEINKEFCINWANAQVEAGATAICYFDPCSSSTIIPRDDYLDKGWKIAKETIAGIKAPTATHFASGRCLPIVNDVATTGTALVGASALEDITMLKEACDRKLTFVGNLNGIAMRNWSPEEAEKIVRDLIKNSAAGGGFILSDNHGEIPFQVPDEILMAISNAVHKWGKYPLK